MGQPVRNFGPVRGWGLDGSWKPKPEGYFKQVATGWQFTVGLRLDGTIEVWGTDGPLGFITNKPPGNDFVQVVAGYEHAYARRANGTVIGWGRSSNGEIATPTTIPNCYTDIACGENFTVAIRCDGTLAAWGLDYCFNPVPRMPPGGPFADVEASGHFVAALRATWEDIPDRLIVWMPSMNPAPGWTPPNWVGPWPPAGCFPQAATLLGEIYCNIPVYLCSNVRFVPQAVLDDFLANFNAGHSHAMAVNLSTGALSIWGSNTFGQAITTPLGTCPGHCTANEGGCAGINCYKSPPAPFPTSVSEAKGGYFHTVIRKIDDRLAGWGRTTDGQSSPPTGKYITFSSTYFHGMAISQCYADCSGDGVVDAADITSWQNRFTLGDLGCDCDGNGVLEATVDFACFMNEHTNTTRCQP
ncbi:MAG: hypothetical protein JNM80_02995 [Phycisphaerae bacterium]|nr:hypothetical protein [Phycisphaerae bacterium]